MRGTCTRMSQYRSWRWVAASLTLGLILAGTSGCPMPPPPDDGGVEEPPTYAPGLKIVVESVSIPDDLLPEVIFRIEDEDGNPVALSELADARFILAYLAETPEGGTERYVSYITRTEDPDGVPNSGDEAEQATYDGARLNGVTPNGDGTYTYKFATAVPAGYPATATHQVAGQFVRDYFVNNEEYVDNPVFAFVPDGSAVTDTREIVMTEVCNKCHTDLTAHGERHEVQLCIECHTPQTSDAQSGNTVDFPQMIHKIHRGANLPSVIAGDPYFIVGFRNTVHDYSDVQYPQDVRNCQSCHDQAPQADAWKTMPTLAGCTSCHDRTWFGNPAATPEGYENHIGGAATNNSLCSQCHTPELIESVHVLPTESAQAPGLALDITNVTTTAVEGGTELTIDFTAVDGDGMPYATLEPLDIVASTVAWPASEYQTYIREGINGFGAPVGPLVNNGGGSYSYTFDALLPASSMDVFSVAMEGRIEFEFDGESVEQGTETNGITHFMLDGTEVSPSPRRMVVDLDNCNECHNNLRFHGELRVGIEYCIMCHNPNTTDAARRPAEALPPNTVNFKNMIHAIHRGEDLSAPFTVYGFGNVAHDFTEVRFPGDESKCTICHKDGTYDVPLPAVAAPTVISEDGQVVSETLPEAAACTSCHDDVLTGVHAALNTDFDTDIESCAVCHGPGEAFAVDFMHGVE